MTPSPDFLLVHLLSLVPDSGGVALDAGCGAGRNLPYLDGEGYSVVALDRVRIPRESSGVYGDIRRLPYRSGVFDLVVCDSVLDTWPAGGDACATSAVAELKRVLKSGGHLIVIVAASEGSDPGITFSKDSVLGWVEDLDVIELLYVRMEYPPVVGVRAQWAILARRR